MLFFIILGFLRLPWAMAVADFTLVTGIPMSRFPAEPWSKTLGRNAALEYTRDSPMFRKRLWAFQETLKPLQGHVGKLLARVKAYCTVS